MPYPFTLRPLPYSYEALCPEISDTTLHFHHDKHLQTYVDNLNKALADCAPCQRMTLEELLQNLDALPADKRIPVLYGIVPILVLLSVEVILSQIITVSPAAKRIFCGTPAILIRDGKIDEKALRRARIGVDELMSELRQNGCAGPDGVKYAIIEANGKLSVIPKASASPPNAEDISVKVKEKGIEHSVIINSKISRRSLSQAEKNSEWLERELAEHRATPEEIILMTVDDTGKVRIQKKKNSVISTEWTL